jgi:hypothetical protein
VGSSKARVQEVARSMGERVSILTGIAVTTLYQGELIQVGTKLDGSKFLYDIITRIFTRFENWSISVRAKEYYDALSKMAPLYLVLCEESGVVKYVMEYHPDLLTKMTKPEDFWLIEAGFEYEKTNGERVHKCT